MRYTRKIYDEFMCMILCTIHGIMDGPTRYRLLRLKKNLNIDFNDFEQNLIRKITTVSFLSILFKIIEKPN